MYIILVSVIFNLSKALELIVVKLFEKIFSYIFASEKRPQILKNLSPNYFPTRYSVHIYSMCVNAYASDIQKGIRRAEIITL